MKSLTIFLDASVILSGLASATGGSRKLFIAAERHEAPSSLRSGYLLPSLRLPVRQAGRERNPSEAESLSHCLLRRSPAERGEDRASPPRAGFSAKGDRLKLLTTSLVIQEVSSHLKKLSIEPDQLENLLSIKTIRLIANPNEEMIEKFSKVSPDPNDAHVLAGAGLSGADILISLDKKHILVPKVRRVLKPMLVKSPKEFWRWLGKLRG